MSSKARKSRWALLGVMSGGTLLAGTCDAISETIRFAFEIVDVWV